jgi:hypothetical protein
LDVGEGLVDLLVHRAEEVDRVQILAPAVAVRYPLSRLARVVEVKHGRHGVHPQAIHVIFLQPEHGTARQERAHLVAAVVEDVTLPVGMEPLARVGVLVEVRAVEEAECELVRGEMGRHPVEDHPDAVLVEVIDQEHEILHEP